MQTVDRLTERINTLTAPQIAEVERFIEALQANYQDRELVRASAPLSETAFDAIWSNPEDDVYDAV